MFELGSKISVFSDQLIKTATIHTEHDNKGCHAEGGTLKSSINDESCETNKLCNTRSEEFKEMYIRIPYTSEMDCDVNRSAQSQTSSQVDLNNLNIDKNRHKMGSLCNYIIT